MLVENPQFVVIGKLRRKSARSAFECSNMFEPASFPDAGAGALGAQHCEHRAVELAGESHRAALWSAVGLAPDNDGRTKGETWELKNPPLNKATSRLSTHAPKWQALL